MSGPDIATCGTCGRSWDFTAHPTPASLCPFCNGDERAAAPHEVVVAGSLPAPAQVEHQPWCDNHATEHDGSERLEVCRRRIVVGDVALDVETSPSWTAADLPIQLPDLVAVDAAGARDYALALLTAARLLEDEGSHR
ncbi:hypothetical protein ACTHQ1_05140 [Janibacter anophelis]|uniref:hypothetical protein n=1 Tax=Janibacter anophelis TaxID=319054 RepID=UPI003F7D8643